MAVVNNIFDSTGAMPVGTGTITINAVTYIVNNEQLTPQWKEAEDVTSGGLPQRKRWTKGRYKYSGEIQLATETTAYPAPGQTFQRTPPEINVAVNFVVLTAPYDASSDPTTIRVIKMTAEEYVNTITTS